MKTISKKKFKIFLTIIIILGLLTISALVITNIVIKNQLKTQLSGKISYAISGVADVPDGIYLYDLKTQKNEQLTLTGFTNLRNITGYKQGSYYCSGWSVTDKKYFILKVENSKVTAKIPAEMPQTVMKYLETAIYWSEDNIYLADFDKSKGTIIIKNGWPDDVNGNTIVFFRQKEISDTSIRKWISLGVETDSPTVDYCVLYTYINGKEKMICNMHNCFGYISNNELLVRDTKNILKRINLETDKHKFIGFAKYDSPDTISPDGKYLLYTNQPGIYDLHYIVHIKTGVRIQLNNFANTSSLEWLEE